MAEADLGFAGMLAAGVDPHAAWARIHTDAQDPAVQAIIAELRRTPQGRAALAHSRARWAAHGLPPPWEPGDRQQPDPGGDS
jgi:hypothetical protein